MADRPLRRWTARVRIVAWLLLFVGAVLGANLVVTARLLQTRAENDVSEELAHEYDKLATYLTRPEGDAERVDELLTEYLGVAFPEEDEAFFTVVDGVADRRSADPLGVRLDRDPAFVARAAGAEGPETGTWTIEGTEVRFGVYPVSVPGDDRPAAFVVAEVVDRDATRSTIALLVAVSVGALSLAGLISWLVAGRLLAPIQAVSRTAERISESDLARRIEVQGDNDVADLARTFNRMLDRIETAFEGQRRFLDDAGHEFRTPLTVIRGHLEVMGDEPEERARVVSLAIGELERMDRIVDDLLVLARAERPDFLDLKAVELADLTVDVVATSRTLAERRWSVSEVAAETAIVDGQRLTQALMQLIANAVDHTEPGDAIDVGSAVRDDRLELWVSDTGRGITPEDRERIFERFATAGERDSSGLGLAIVSSIAEAHGGAVTLDSELGVGSTFTLVLPGRCLVRAPGDGVEDLDAGGGEPAEDASDEATAASSSMVETPELGGTAHGPHPDR